MKKILSILCCISIIFTLSACGSAAPEAKKFNKKAKNSSVTDPLIAENERFKLEYDGATAGVVLTELSSGKKWGTTPAEEGEPAVDEYGMPIKRHPRLQSPITIKYRDYETGVVKQSLSYNDAVTDGRVRCAKGKASLLVEYYFDTAEIMVPVEYKLLEDSVQVSINPDRIEENDNTLFEVSVAPFWCASENSNEDGYLFVPSGCGALIDTSVRSSQGEIYSAQIYGRDYTNALETEVTVEESVKLPVFGAKISSDKAALAVITSGAESGIIAANAGSSAIGYSSVYTTFKVRGSTEHITEVFVGKKTQSLVYSDLLVKKPFSVRYYPLTNENADYNGMASCYREYLKKEKKLKENKNDVPFAVEFVGGTTITKSFLGIPYKSFFATTTLSEAEEIVSDLQKKTNTDFPIMLKGFGQSGIDIGKIAGGFTLNKKTGSTKALKSLNDICKKLGNALYMDFDLVRFSKSSGGFSTAFDSVYDVTNKQAMQYLYNASTRDYNEKTMHSLLNHNGIGEAAEKLISKAGALSVDGVSLGTLSNMSYSDYRDKTTAEYYCGIGTEKLVSGIFSKVKKSGKSVMASSANAYAAIKADIITDTPTSSSADNLFFADIPFYQMVFKGYVPMVSGAQNLSGSDKKEILKSVESGCGLGYKVTAKWDNCLIDSATPVFYNSVYSEIGEDIAYNQSKLADYYKSIKGAEISSHKILQNGVRETIFDNNVKVYVNFTDKSLSSPAGEIAPNDFLMKEGE